MNDESEIVLPAYPGGYRLQTKRLQLRAIAPEDAQGLWPLMSDPRLTTFLAWEPHKSVEETEEDV